MGDGDAQYTMATDARVKKKLEVVRNEVAIRERGAVLGTRLYSAIRGWIGG